MFVTHDLRPARRDDGSVLVLSALIITALLVFVALVVDLGFVRQNRQADKSATDFAAAAGIRALDDGSGAVVPWLGICAARDFLMANNQELAGMTPSYTDGSGGAVIDAGGSPVADPCATPPPTPCESSDPSTWGVLVGAADGGRIVVEIENGYRLNASYSGFPEDDAAYAGDVGTDPCEHLAVIIRERAAPHFGAVAGSSGHTTRIRSVARLRVTADPGTPGLLLLERTRCEVVEVQGAGPRLVSGGFGTASGLIHADSDGTGSNCNSTDGHIFEVNTNASYPRIIARKGTGASSPPGQLSTVALWGDSNSAFVTSGSPHEVCAQAASTDCAVPPPDPPPSVTGSQPIGRALVTRSPVDARYLAPIRVLRQTAVDYFSWTTANPPPSSSGFVIRPCAYAGTFTEPKIWIDCEETGTFSGGGKTFTSTVAEVVVNGRVEVGGSSSVLEFANPRAVFVKGSTSSSGMRLAGGSGNAVLINRNGFTDSDADGSVCDERSASSADRLERTKLVIGAGQLVVEGSSKTMRMCQTTVFMMDDTDGACSLPAAATPAQAPIDDDGCRGQVQIAGQGIVDWTAPNANVSSVPSHAELQQLEDLALWTETRGASSLSRIEGSGMITLSGVFFAPNADPFRIAGQGGYDTVDAQFVSRRLEVGGGGELLMSPDPQNAVPLPTIGGFVLVR